MTNISKPFYEPLFGKLDAYQVFSTAVGYLAIASLIGIGIYIFIIMRRKTKPAISDYGFDKWYPFKDDIL